MDPELAPDQSRPRRPAHPLARLLRLSNALTPIADVAAGGLFRLWVDGASLDGFAWLACGLASWCVYSAGMVFNDVFDQVEDRELRPTRPIPSGEISVFRAKLIGVLLIGTAVSASALAGLSSLVILTLILGLALTYDMAPSGLGGSRLLLVPVCRSLNVLLGATAAGWPSFDETPGLFAYAAVYGAYILMASCFGVMEDRPVRRARLPWLTFGTMVLITLPLVLGLSLRRSDQSLGMVIPLGLWSWWATRTVPGLMRAWRSARSEMMGRTVGLLLRGVLLFHGVLATGVAPTPLLQTGVAIAFLAGDLLTRQLARRIPPT